MTTFVTTYLLWEKININCFFAPLFSEMLRRHVENFRGGGGQAPNTDLNYWIKLLSCMIEANGGHIGLSHINLHWYYWGSSRGFYRFRLLVGMDKHCVNEISFTHNFCFFLNLPVNNELGIVQDGRHEFIIKCFKPSQNH